MNTYSTLTSKQYMILLDLFNEFPADFGLITITTQNAFYDILYGRLKVKPF